MSRNELSNSPETATAVDFMSLLGRCLGNFTVVERVIATFRETGASDLMQLQAAIEAADFHTVAEVAHRFKGAASNVSAKELAQRLLRAETAGREQNQAELSLILFDLQLQWEKFLQFASAFGSSTGPANKSAGHEPAITSPDIREKRHACVGC